MDIRFRDLHDAKLKGGVTPFFRKAILSLTAVGVLMTPGMTPGAAFAAGLSDGAPERESGTATRNPAPCHADSFDGHALTVCRTGADSDVRLFLQDEEGAPYRHFHAVNKALEARGERLAFAMNAGMYLRDRSPAGLYVEDGVSFKRVNTNPGPGNFHMLPNGVFWVAQGEDGAARLHVHQTSEYIEAAKEQTVRYASQSGPMLVINGALHPRFIKDSDSRKRRNGVGIDKEGNAIFVISEGAINFYDFARYFRDKLKTDNALFLDGTISRLYAPSLERNDPGLSMGPIVGVIANDD